MDIIGADNSASLLSGAFVGAFLGAVGVWLKTKRTKVEISPSYITRGEHTALCDRIAKLEERNDRMAERFDRIIPVIYRIAGKLGVPGGGTP